MKAGIMRALMFLVLMFWVVRPVAGQTLLYNPDLKPFYHGVASGDPTSNSVILWTRYTPEDEDMSGSVNIRWEVSASPDFTPIAWSGVVRTNAARDWTVKTEVGMGDANTYYYYRFRAPDGTYSMTGRTKSAPDGPHDNIRLASVSCSSLYSGYFNAYRRIAERNDIDAVVHAGDFVYDFFDSREANRLPTEEILAEIQSPEGTEGWRKLHAYWRLDPDLRAAMQQHPWIVMWDNHDLGDFEMGDTSGSAKAFFEWLPVREFPENPERIYRKLKYGDLLEIYMLDINPYRDDEESNFGDEIDDYGRTILGDEQREWFLGELAHSQTKWRLFCSSKPMGQWHIFGLPDILPVDLPGINDLGFPISNNSWDGYPREREAICQFLRENDINNNIVVSGDVHAYIFSDLVENPYNPFLYTPNGGGEPVGAEFVSGSVTRVNLDETVPLPIYPGFGDFVEGLIRFLNPHYVYMDFVNHGYGILDFRSERTTGEVWLTDKVIRSDYEKMDAAFECRDGRNRWHRGRIDLPTTALQEGADFAPFEDFDWETLSVRQGMPSGPVTGSGAILSEIYPNPSSGSPWFRFETKESVRVRMELVETVSGRVIATLYDGWVGGGHTFVYRIDREMMPAAGMYSVVVEGDGIRETRSFIQMDPGNTLPAR